MVSVFKVAVVSLSNSGNNVRSWLSAGPNSNR